MKEAQRTLNPDHPDHPKNVAARESIRSTEGQTQANETATTASTEAQDMKNETVPGSTPDSDPPGTDETVKNGPHTGAKVEKSPEPVSKIWSKDKLFGECLAFTNDFANAGNLTGRAMLSFIERAQGIMNEYKKAKDAQAPKGKKK